MSGMSRREFVTLLGGAAAAWPLAARAQQGGKRYIVGLLSAGGGGVQAALNSAFIDGLREWGWVEGKNVVFENRNAEDRLEVDDGEIRADPRIAREILEFIEERRVLSVAMTDGIIGCPHQEGIDYEGEWCPLCEFWHGRDRFTGQPVN
jgi:hypothetical protein